MKLHTTKIVFLLLFLLGVAGCESGSITGAGEEQVARDAYGTPVYLGSGTPASFSKGKLALGVSQLSAGGKTSVTASMVTDDGNMYTDEVEVKFYSFCSGQKLAALESPITLSDGFAVSTYTANGCPNEDKITAEAVVGGVKLTASSDISIESADVGQIMFGSAEPEMIGIKGSGLNQSSRLTFIVLDSAGNPVFNQPVDFTLSTAQGGIELSQYSDISDSSGEVSTVVAAGTVPTAVRVTAELQENPSIATQSDKLVISTGLADQDSFSISTEQFNTESWGYNGETTALTVHAADQNNNPVPDGSRIYFTTEGGQIEPSCSTTNGSCSVQWTSADPRPEDGRVTVTATMQGEESFSDSNGNGVLDDDEHFTDMPEAFYDYNENGLFNLTSALFDRYGDSYYETFRDYNQNQRYDAPDGEYNGLLCNPSNVINVCSDDRSIDARNNIVLVMGGSFASNSTLSAENGIYDGYTWDLSGEGIGYMTITIADENGNAMPYETDVEISVDDGLELLSESSYVMPDSTSTSGVTFPIRIQLKADAEVSSSYIEIKIVTPKGNETYLGAVVTW